MHLLIVVTLFSSHNILHAQENYKSIELFDSIRHRAIPVALYVSATSKDAKALVIISHGYEGKNTAYSFIANDLAAKGYVVASIQQELPGDPPLATDGVLTVTRKSNWQNGVDNIRFVIEALQRQGIATKGKGSIVIGHSNGGDLSMLFAMEYPELTSAVLSLDNRRMPLPRTAKPRVCSIRSSDQQPDEGVLPDTKQQLDLQMVIGSVPGLEHNQMWDGATEEQKSKMLALIAECLKGN
ncbi:alpha/beta hydrolase [Mesorhizobium loti]|nr:alpha/beta hydrolase [Mesorhizobium loti]